MKNTLFILLLITLFASCETVVTDVEIPEVSRKTVVELAMGNLTSTYKASLTKSNPIFNSRPGEFEVIADATLVVSGNGISDTFLYDVSNAVYTSRKNYNFAPGQIYELNIKTKDGNSVSSKAAYPVAATGIETKVDSVVQFGETIYRFHVKWDDQLGVNDYYQLECYTVFEYEPGLTDTIFGGFYREYVGPDDIINSNYVADGEFYKYEGGGVNDVKVFIVISGISEEHYKYGRVLEKYNPDNPFSEPTLIPTNIEGGLGMFVLKNSVVTEL
ncbi:MAG: DUF4249 domain-containing protein [Flavobacteriales bacterium]|nr:DUF4249 domain-containing protein [Flavobacteriales bacterium]